MQADKFNLYESESWAQYLWYKSLNSDSTDEELNDFVNQKAEACCGMCPVNPENFSLLSRW